jgi:hypothetical protein
VEEAAALLFVLFGVFPISLSTLLIQGSIVAKKGKKVGSNHIL